MFKKPILAGLMGLSLLHGSSHVSAETFNTIDAVTSALNMECIDYCITGICTHLKCDPLCSTYVSFQVKHNLPEFIVSVYDEVSEQPYTEYKPLQELATSWIGNKGSGLMQQDRLNSQPLVFKNASVLGHPFLLFADPPTRTINVRKHGTPGNYTFDTRLGGRWVPAIGANDSNFNTSGSGWGGENSVGYVLQFGTADIPNFTSFQEQMGAKIDSAISSTFSLLMNNPVFKGFCPSTVEYFKPYYDSNVDFFEWRFGVIDRIKAIQNGAHIPGRREIGSLNSINPLNRAGNNTWGSVYPRIGFVMQDDDPKAAAVIAQRAIDITTRNDSWRIKKASYVGASNEKTDKWQMISPKKDSSCRSFGSKDSGWSKDRNPDGKGQYAWNYWGDYSCCLGGGNVIYVVPITLCLNDIF